MKYFHSRNIAKAVGILSILVAVGILAPLTYYTLHNAVVDAQGSTSAPVVRPITTPKAITGYPVHLTIPSLGINLQIVPGHYNPQNGNWTLTLDKAQFAEPSMQPNNETGNTLIYGHYRVGVFLNLHKITPGSEVQITTDNGYVFTYVYERTEAFDPRDTSIFTYKGSPRLTLQTCSGAFYQHRQMYYFAYKSYKHVK